MAWLQKGSETHNLVVSQIIFSPLLYSGICIPTTKRPWWRWMDHLLSTSLKTQNLMQTWGRVSSSVWALTPRQWHRSQLCSCYSGYSGLSVVSEPLMEGSLLASTGWDPDSSPLLFYRERKFDQAEWGMEGNCPNSLQDNIFRPTLQNNILQTCESGQYFMKHRYKRV